MKKLLLVTAAALLLAIGPALANVTCEGTLEYGSGGDRIGKCWFGETENMDIAVTTVCKPHEHCRVIGKAGICR